jgi:ribosome-binding protein aMBF1 (putative translation factor)
MDNIRDENLKKLGKYIAESLIEQALETSKDDWLETDIKDHTIGELARCVTLNNLYLDREEYEKCAIMKLRIQELSDKLNIKNNFLKDLENDEE